MKKVLIIGASGSLARYVIEALKRMENVALILFLRNEGRLAKSTGGGRTIIGGIAETQEMLAFCSKHDITAEIERINIQDINHALERLEKGDVKYRFVIDMVSL